MSDAIEKSNLTTEKIEKVNNASSNTAGRSKLKRRKSDTRKNHRSKSSTSRKTKTASKPLDTRNRKNRDAGDQSNSEIQSNSPHFYVKEEVFSDDHNSSVSDKPLLLTRSRIRRIERRKAYSSNSSVVDSDQRKTKSEPIIITLDSDSDDNVSLVSNRPSRTARIKGEIIRKLSRTTTSKITTYKASDYSSSSECESNKRKKKSKTKSVKTSSSSQAAKRKKYLVNTLACQSRLKLRKHKRPHITHVYRPLKKKKDLRSLRKRFEEHKTSNQINKPSPTKKIPQPISERRSLRSTSIEISTDSIKSETVDNNSKIDNEIKFQAEVKAVLEAKKRSEIKKQVKKEANIFPEKKEEIAENACEDLKISESKIEQTSEKKIDSPSKVIIESSHEDEKKIQDDSLINSTSGIKSTENIEASSNMQSSSNIEPFSSIEQSSNNQPSSDINQSLNIDLSQNNVQSSNINPTPNAISSSNIDPSPDAVPSSKIDPFSTVDTLPVSEMELDIKNTVTNRDSTETASSEEGTKESIKKDVARIKVLPKVKKMKKKILKLKPGDKIIRKRGRPRLSEITPVRSIQVINDVIQHPFLQKTFCFSSAPKLPKCRECRILVNRSVRNMNHSYCRFMEYRKLCHSRTGAILNAGFSLPEEATKEDIKQWMPAIDSPPKDLDQSTSKALLEHIGDQFCDLVIQERGAIALHIGYEDVITWKRIVQGVREMCDVCFTTLFNHHWVCPVCGLAICIDCYKGRKQGITVEYEDGQPKNRDQYNWLLCSLRQPHDPKKLILAQIIPASVLWYMKDMLHIARDKWNIPSYCKCNPQTVVSSDKYISTGICKQLMCFVTKTFSTEHSNSYFNNDSNVHSSENNYDDLDIEVSQTALKWLEGNIVENFEGMKSSDDFCNSYEDFASLRGNLLNGINSDDISSESEREISSFSLDDIIACVTKSQDSENKENACKPVIKHFSNRYPQPNSGRDPLPIRIYTKLESNLSFVNVPHSWFCNGRLLFLLQSDHPDNLTLFQEQWKRGQPILVKGVDERLSKELWHPDAFCRDFGEVRNDLVDCRTGAIIKNLPMRRFWEGFESFSKRLKDDNNEYMLLKLKDWPPGEDFSEMLPQRFLDLMKGLPLPEYTRRDGILNLAGRLPSWFVRPDLGPKMYNAYGSALYPTKGTTNLHLDVSDAVNVMVYVGIPQDGNAQLHIEEALKAIDEGGCDSLMRARVRARGAKPGALWHIYNARDADKIREMLTKVAMERGEKLEAHHDPIHDQSWYLDAELRKRLYRDYGVEGYAIAQCLGDAVFIPAGAPHQVRNLHSCVKVAEDFVSPENIAHCFKLTQEFRHLSDTHTNHEDKLQIKNIIYHVVRDALAHLLEEHEIPVQKMCS